MNEDSPIVELPDIEREFKNTFGCGSGNNVILVVNLY